MLLSNKTKFNVMIIGLMLLFVLSTGNLIAGNDTPGEAQLIGLNADFTGKINPQGDVDWVKFNVTKEGELDIDLVVPWPENYDIELYYYTGSYYRKIAESKSTIWGKNENIKYTVTTPRYYYVKIYGPGSGD